MPIQRSCLVCQTPFYTTASVISEGHGLYCSNTCSMHTRKTSITKSCRTCSVLFDVEPNQIARGRGLFCSMKCRRQANGTMLERFWKKVDTESTPNDCWPWTASCDGSGYGMFRAYGKTMRAHCFIYEMTHGPVLPLFLICHSCDNPPCCRDEHLFPGDHWINAADMRHKGRQSHGEKHSAIRKKSLIENPQSIKRGGQHWNAKLKEDDVRKILQLNDTMTQQSIADMFGVTLGMINHIVLRKAWTHIV